MPRHWDLDTYVVMRIDGGRGAPHGGGLLQSARSSGGARSEAGLARISVEGAKLTNGQREKVDEDPRQLTVPTMPVALVAPLAASDADDEHALEAAKAKGWSWGVEAVGALNAHNNGEDVVVAMLDTAVNMDHAAFRGVSFTTRDFLTHPANPDEKPPTHGTHCLSTILGRDVDGVRIGVAPGVPRALVGRVLDNDGCGGNLEVISALQWAATEGADVISMSLGFDFIGMARTLKDAGWPEEVAFSRALQAYSDNVRRFDSMIAALANNPGPDGETPLIIAASGNDSRRNENPDYVIDVKMPAATKQVISVGAVARDGTVAPFSNRRPRLCAPGVGIVGANANDPNGLVAQNGTSMACPHVAGVAALWWRHSLLTTGAAMADDVAANLVGSARKIDGAQVRECGRGVPQAPQRE